MKNDLNPVELERRKEKLKLRRKIKNKKGHESATRDKEVGTGDNHARGNKSHESTSERTPDVSKLGAKSIYYDPQWNPYGIVPTRYSTQYKNLYYNAIKFRPNDQPVSDAELLILSNTKVPEGEPPRFYKRDLSTIIESEEKISTLIPASMLRKKQKLN